MFPASTPTAVPDGVSDDGVFVDDGVTDGTVLATMGCPSMKKSASHTTAGNSDKIKLGLRLYRHQLQLVCHCFSL